MLFKRLFEMSGDGDAWVRALSPYFLSWEEVDLFFENVGCFLEVLRCLFLVFAVVYARRQEKNKQTSDTNFSGLTCRILFSCPSDPVHVGTT